MEKKKESKTKGIVLNRMYAGDYLSNNLGHEVINMFQADNGKHYLYLNAYGNFGKDHLGQIGYMLLVKYHSEGLLEVIGKAEGLTDVDGADAKLSQDYKSLNPNISQIQNEYIERENITYGGVPIRKIFNDAEQQNIFITYKATRLYKPTKRIFIGYGVKADIVLTGYKQAKTSLKTVPCKGDTVYVVLTGYKQAKTSLKTYVYPEGTFNVDQKRESIEEKKTDYKKLIGLIEKKDLWDESNERINDDILKIKSRDMSIFDICQIQNDENRFSYALAYFMTQPQYKKLWQNFFKQYGVELSENYSVTREESAKIEDDKWNHAESQSGGRIDLLIRDEKNIIVIENKIKSDINAIASDGDDSTQLNRYVNYIKWCTQGDKPSSKRPDIGKKAHFFILTPNYNIPEIRDDMKKYYKTITYRDLYDFLKITSVVKEDSNFKAFFEAMHRHTHDNVNDYLYYDMLEKFVRRINEINKEKSEL